MFLAFVLAVGCVGYRPHKTYANPVLAVSAYEIFYGLLLSMGIVLASGADHDAKMDAAASFFESLSLPGQGAFSAIFDSMVSVGNGLYVATDGFDRDALSALWDAVRGVEGGTVYNPSFAGAVPYSFPADKSADFYSTPIYLGACSDSPFVVIFGGYNARVYSLLPDNHYLHYTVAYDTGLVSDVKYGVCSADVQLRLKAGYRSATSVNYSVFAEPSIDGFNIGGNFAFVNNGTSPGGMVWGNSSSSFITGTSFPGSLTYRDGVAFEDEGLLDCDTWADAMSKTGEVDKEVGIYTGKDLAGYDTSESAYDGLITGVENPAIPVSPEIPVAPDLTGITGILKNILDWLKALPATLANTFLGDADLDFDALKNNGFTTKFPFSIPFDLFNCISQLVATPVPPVFTLSFAGTIMQSAGDIVIDMGKFEVLAKIIRFFVFFGFVLALIKLTRDLIKG